MIVDRLASSGIQAVDYPNALALATALDRGHVGAAVVTSEGVGGAPDEEAFRMAIEGQPPWSDVPLILLGQDGRPASEALRIVATIGAEQSATVLNRPVSGSSLVAAVRLALAARRRQHEVRGLLTDLEALNASLERRVEEGTREVRRLARALTTAEQEERRRIAYLLHEDVQQRLYGLSITLAMVSRAPELAGAADALRLLDRAETAVQEAAALTRSLSHDLAPPVLRDSDLRALLESLAERARSTHGLAVAVAVGEGVSVPEEPIRVLLYQVLRELLFNVSKHAGTDQASITASREGGAVRIDVSDDGDGFDTDNTDIGLGLASARERIALVGGSLEVSSKEGESARVSVTVPGDDPARA